jgi:hypothetical protein
LIPFSISFFLTYSHDEFDLFHLRSFFPSACNRHFTVDKRRTQKRRAILFLKGHLFKKTQATQYESIIPSGCIALSRSARRCSSHCRHLISDWAWPAIREFSDANTFNPAKTRSRVARSLSRLPNRRGAMCA